MIKRSSLGGVAHDIGDTKTRYAPSVNPLDTAVLPFNGQEWLRTGYLIPYAAKYAAQLAASIGRGLYAYDGVAEQGVSTNGAYTKAQATVDYYGGRYYFFPDYAGTYTVQSKMAFDSNATLGTASAGQPGGQGISEMRALFVIKSGAAAGRVLLATNGNAGFKVQHGTGAIPAWSDANFGGGAVGGDIRLIVGKSDGSLIATIAEAVSATFGAGNIRTSTNGGTVWTSQTSNLATYNATPYEGVWCPTLNKFVFVATWSNGSVMQFYTSADASTWAVEAGTPPANPTGRVTCYIADTGTATVVLGNASNLYRSLAGGAFASVATPRQLVGIVAAGANLYALNSSNGLELSTDNGTTWTYLGQVNGPQPGPTSGGNALLRVANGNLFISSGVSFMRFPLQPLPGLTPDRIGAVNAVQVPSGQTNAATFVRIL